MSGPIFFCGKYFKRLTAAFDSASNCKGTICMKYVKPFFCEKIEELSDANFLGKNYFKMLTAGC